MRTKARFDVLVLEARTKREKLNTVVAGVKPVLDCVDLEADPVPSERPPRPDAIIDRCKAAWENFKSFNWDAATSVVTHALVVVRSHYPAINLQVIGVGFARGTSMAKEEQLKDEVEDATKKLVSNVDLFGEEVDTQPQ